MDTQITVVLDSSGSMQSIKADTIGGFNAFLADQRAEDGTAAVTLFEFADEVSRVYRGIDLAAADDLDGQRYTPGGRTALHDAVHAAVTDTERLVAERESAAEAAPENVVVVVLTDGKENASETPAEAVREQVEAKQAAGWEFLFIGANQDAALAAGELGIDRDHSLDMAHSGEGTDAAFDSTSAVVSDLREEGSTEGFREEDRERQETASE